jgi:hypothetical protein
VVGRYNTREESFYQKKNTREESSARLESFFEAKIRLLIPKSCVCVFGKYKKHGLKFVFSLKNRGLTMDLKAPFSKNAFNQKS